VAAMFDPVIRERLFELSKYRPASSAHARQVLGWAPRSNEEAVMATAESLLQEGIV
jgi:nucleoside-diphosphate-sugar epimerase